MLRTGGMPAFDEAVHMAGNTLPLMINGDGAITGLDFNRLFDQVVRHRVVVFLVFDVVIDMHLGLFDLGVLIGLWGQRP